MSSKNGVTTIRNVVAGVLLEIGDEKNRQFYNRAFQWVIDEYRRLVVHVAPFYSEKKVQLEEKRYSADYPDDAVKILSVGLYSNGEFRPFTKNANLSLYPVDAEDDIWEGGDGEGYGVPKKGFGYAAKGSSMGYWADDYNNRLIYVRNYRWNKINEEYQNNTGNLLTGKVIVRYKTTGIDCGEDVCIPYEYRELLISLVTYRFMQKHIPVRPTTDILNRKQMDIMVREEEFEELTFGIKNLWEVKDAIYASLNTTARR